MDESKESQGASLRTDVQFLKGVGPERAPLLRRLGLKTAQDVLFRFPRDYEDLSQLQSIDALQEGTVASVLGQIVEIDSRTTRSGGHVFGALVQQGTSFLRAIWFNQPTMRHRITTGQQVVLAGRVSCAGGRWEMTHPRLKVLGAETLARGEILPIYALTEGLKQGHMRRIARYVVECCVGQVQEVLPEPFRERYRLPSIQAALPQIHAPSDQQALARARRRFVFQELLVMQLALGLRRRLASSVWHAHALPATPQIDMRIRRVLPYELTPGQAQAVDEIRSDMARETPMNRLLQGDVGSGKTLVAIYASLLTIAHSRQVILMAPTEVLARQHAQTLQGILAHAKVRVELLTGAVTGMRRTQITDSMKAGQIDLLIGTQAVLHEQDSFDNVGLVVVDEQHKFGVRQRAGLRTVGKTPHYLVMTATPIPRTVAMSLYGDLDVSIIRDAPAGRQPVRTYLADGSQRPQWWKFFAKKLREGRQGYVITPLVDATEGDLSSVEAVYESLCNGFLEEFRVGLVHGRMSATEKETAMAQFQDGMTQALVATSVVEVGVDVPNANVMTIENGERFGLTQLHQLRGRVGRGQYPGYVCVFCEDPSTAAGQRLESFVATEDGFELSEIDFKIRGPGDLFGTKQHGLPPFRIADLRRDEATLDEARAAATKLLEEDPNFEAEAYQPLKQMVIGRYGKTMDLGDVG